MKIKNREELIAKQEEYRASLNSQRKQILICAGTGCVAGGSLEIYAKMKDIIESKGLKCALVLEKDPHGDSIGLKRVAATVFVRWDRFFVSSRWDGCT